MRKIHARWLVAAAVVSSAAGLVICPAGSLVLAAVLCLLSLDMTPRALDCRLQITIVCTALLALGMMAVLESATTWWAVLACPPMVWLFGRRRSDDIARHDAAVPERPWERKESRKPARRRRRRPQLVVIQVPPGQQIPPQPAWDLHEFRASGDRTMWR